MEIQQQCQQQKNGLSHLQQQLILTEGDLFLSGGTTLKGFGKAAGIPAATWASGASLNTARRALAGAGANNDAALAFGGLSTSSDK